MGKKALVLARNYNYYTLYIRNKSLNPYEYPYVIPERDDLLRGISPDTPVYWLEGWSDNMYSIDDVKYLKNHFKNHKEISKGWIENEGFKF